MKSRAPSTHMLKNLIDPRLCGSVVRIEAPPALLAVAEFAAYDGSREGLYIGIAPEPSRPNLRAASRSPRPARRRSSRPGRRGGRPRCRTRPGSPPSPAPRSWSAMSGPVPCTQRPGRDSRPPRPASPCAPASKVTRWTSETHPSLSFLFSVSMSLRAAAMSRPRLNVLDG